MAIDPEAKPNTPRPHYHVLNNPDRFVGGLDLASWVQEQPIDPELREEVAERPGLAVISLLDRLSEMVNENPEWERWNFVDDRRLPNGKFAFERVSTPVISAPPDTYPATRLKITSPNESDGRGFLVVEKTIKQPTSSGGIATDVYAGQHVLWTPDSGEEPDVSIYDGSRYHRDLEAIGERAQPLRDNLVATLVAAQVQLSLVR